MTRKELNEIFRCLHLNEFVHPLEPAVNGLQFGNNDNIKKIAFGVTASKAFIEQAIDEKADTLVVHHGLLWRKPNYSQLFLDKLVLLKQNSLNLWAYHLPLDIHPWFGNALALGEWFSQMLENADNCESITKVHSTMNNFDGLNIAAQIQCTKKGIGNYIFLESPKNLHYPSIIGKFNYLPPGTKDLRICLIPGAGSTFHEEALSRGFNVFVTGEMSFLSEDIARETKTAFYSIGHHFSELFGIKKLSEYINTNIREVETIFIDTKNEA